MCGQEYTFSSGFSPIFIEICGNLHTDSSGVCIQSFSKGLLSIESCCKILVEVGST